MDNIISKKQKEEIKVIKIKIMEYMKNIEFTPDHSCLFDDLERGIPNIKDKSEKGELYGWITADPPYQNIVFWALSILGTKALKELLSEKKIEIKPSKNPQMAMLSYMAGTNEWNEAQKLPLVKRLYKYKKKHWWPSSIQLKLF